MYIEVLYPIHTLTLRHSDVNLLCRSQGEGVSDSGSPYKRPRTQSPSLMSNPGSTNPGQPAHYAFSQEAPRYAMAVASSPYDALYRAQAYQVC